MLALCMRLNAKLPPTCFIETPTGDIDARLNSQFEVIEDALLSGEEETG